MALSYNGWQASRDPKAIGVNQKWEPLEGHRFPGGIKGGDVETVMTRLVQQLDMRVEAIDIKAVKDEWGYHYKQSANSPKLLSCHSSATAVDYNATLHPNGKRGTWTAQQYKEIRKILDELDGVVGWLALKADGGNARGTPDEMHFEIRGTANEVARVAARLRGTPPTPPEDDVTSDFYPFQVPADGTPFNIAVPPSWEDKYDNAVAWFTAVTDLGGPLSLRVACFTGQGEIAYIDENFTTSGPTGGNGFEIPKGCRGISVVNNGTVTAGVSIELVRP